MAETKTYFLTAPAALGFEAEAKVKQWLAVEGARVKQGDRLVVLTDGVRTVLDVRAPTDGVVDTINIYADELAPTGVVLGTLQVAADYTDNTQRDWQNFDKLSELLVDYVDKARNPRQLKDMNDALGELLDINEDSVFRKMNTDQQNQFIQAVVKEHSEKGSSPVTMAQKLLEGLQLRTPQLAPATPTPAYGLRPSAPGLGGGGAARVVQQQATQPPVTSTNDDQ
jgi:pyruvate/2-oxoglutarate dehydrogenase complex dihydrolipoamide acyltransferase (E2) component